MNRANHVTQREYDALIVFCLLFVCILLLDIPDEEAQYWTGKLERINTMGIHDEVKYRYVVNFF